MTEPDLRPPQQRVRARTSSSGTTRWLWIALVIAALGYGAWYAREYWAAQQRSAVPAAVAPSEPVSVAAETASVPPVSEAIEPVPAPEAAPDQPRHPVSMTAGNALDGNDALALDRWAGEWLGPQALKFLVMPGLAHYVVATVDNLPRSHAAPRVWPLYPVGGQMPLSHTAQGMHIADANSARYDAVVGFVTSMEPTQVASWYRQAYPVLQHAYENLGYPGQYFNDRLVAVIDHLLQTPQVQGPMAVRLVQVQGQIAPQQPWLRYEFADPQLQALSAGQKILLRLGAEHRQRITTYLQALRSQIAA